MDRTLSGQTFAAVERQFFEQGNQLEADIASESEARRERPISPGPPAPPRQSFLGKVLMLMVVVAGVSFIGHRWFTGGGMPTPVAAAVQAIAR